MMQNSRDRRMSSIRVSTEYPDPVGYVGNPSNSNNIVSATYMYITVIHSSPLDLNGDSYPQLERSSLTIYNLYTCIYVCNTYLNII